MLDMALRAGAKAFEDYKNNPSIDRFDVQENGVNFRVHVDTDKNGFPRVGNVYPIK